MWIGLSWLRFSSNDRYLNTMREIRVPQNEMCVVTQMFSLLFSMSLSVNRYLIS
jgi:hypothetical protein